MERADHRSQISIVIGVTVLALSVATVAVTVRTYTRKWIVDRMGVDDCFAIVALVLAYGCGTSILCMTQYGLGTHVDMVDESLVPLYLRAFYVSIVLYCAGLFAIKMTFLVQYYRVFGVQNLRYVFAVAIIVVGGWSLSQLFVGIFACTPVSGYWDKTIDSTCIPNLPQWYINAAGNIFTDLAIFFLPMPILSKLNLPRPQKLVLFGIFSLGFFTLAISVLRIKYLKLFQDFTWENVESSSWSIAELCCGITCSCLPTLRPFVTRHFGSFDSTLTRLSSPGDPVRDGLPVQEVRPNEAGSRAVPTGSGTSQEVHAPRRSVSTRRTEDAYGSPGEGSDGPSSHAPESITRSPAHGYAGGSESRNALLGLQTTVQTTVGSASTSPTSPSGNVIQVQRDVYQVRGRGMTE